MKKIVLGMAVAIALLNAASTYAVTMSVAPVVPVPEPGSFVQLAAGILALGGLAFVIRKQARTNEVN